MTPATISLTAFFCIFGAAIVGMVLKDRLPEHHLNEESKHIIKAARGVVIGLAALTLGLLIATAKSSFDGKQTELKESAAKMIALNRLLLKDGPQSEKARGALRQVAVKGIILIEKITRDGMDHKLVSGETLDDFISSLKDLPEGNANQIWIKNSALSLANDITLSRWRIYQGSTSSISPLFLMVLVFWLMTIFFSLGLIAPFNSLVISSLFTASISMTGAILLTLEMDQPYGGFVQMSTEPLKLALQQFK
jgi:hypothetical protein